VDDYERVTHILFGNAVKLGGGGTGPQYMNPYADMVRGYKEYNRTLISAQVEARQDISSLTKGLKTRLLLNTTRYSYSDVSRQYNPFYYTIRSYDMPTNTYTLNNLNQGTEYLNYNEGGKDVTTTNYVEMSLDYNNAFGDHSVSGMLVLTMQDRKISNAGNIQKSLPYRNQGLAGRFTYAYASKYFAEFNFGYNGSERFAANERFGFFPSIGAGYIISNESFWKSWQKTVNKLKFKLTYGLVGNDAIGSEDDRFFYLSELNMSDGNKTIDFGREFKNPQAKNGISINRYPNNLITWERSKKLNAGFELGMFNNMIDIQADFFYEYRDRILQSRSHIPTTMGLRNTPKANIGEASSQGVDLSVDYSFISRKDFWASARANFTYAVSEYKVLDESDYASYGRPWSSAVGRNFSQRNGYIAERLFIDEADVANSPLQEFGEYGPGDIKYKDINNDGKITDADRVYFGYPTTPEITYGFGFSTGYKGFDMSMFFQGNARVSFYLDPGKIAPFVNETALLDKIAKDHWSESNRNSYAFWPKLAEDRYINNNHQSSTWWMQNGTFFRVKTIEVGYSLPKKIAKVLGMEICRLYLTGNNLFTLSKFKLWDPEMGDNGLGYPIQKVYNIGLNINL
jgi:TonB-linked SusC/RagA family outer membrane protein